MYIFPIFFLLLKPEPWQILIKKVVFFVLWKSSHWLLNLTYENMSQIIWNDLIVCFEKMGFGFLAAWRTALCLENNTLMNDVFCLFVFIKLSQIVCLIKTHFLIYLYLFITGNSDFLNSYMHVSFSRTLLYSLKR